MVRVPSLQQTSPGPVEPASHLARPVVPVTAWAAYFLRLGTLGFGGPIALSAAMQRDLVEERRWITSDEYKEGPGARATRARAAR